MCPSRSGPAMWSQPPPPEPASYRARAAAENRHRCGCYARRTAAECGVSVTGRERTSGLRVRVEPQYQNVKQLRSHPDYANLEEITREYGYRLCPEGQNLEDEAMYENIMSVRRLRCDASASSPELCLVPASKVPYYEEKGYVVSATFGRSGTFPQCPPATWSRLQHACRLARASSEAASLHRVQMLPAPGGSLNMHAKKEMYDVKKQRLCLAQDEYKALNNALSTLAASRTASRTSLCSSTTSVTTTSASSRHDPELLRSDVVAARGRVARLRKELRQARAEVACARRGVDTLAEVEQKMSSQQGCYNITEAQAIMTELKNIQKSLTSGEKEKADLMQSLAKLKDDLTRLQLGEIAPDLSTLSIPHEKLSTASQTDLCADLVPIGTRLAEMARIRLQYDEARKQIQHIQRQLADLEDKVQPGQAESDKDRLLLFQEKEQLLRELRSITPRTRSKREMSDIRSECERLERDLKNAFEMSNKCIADRLRLHEEKQLLLQQLKDALQSMTALEGQLKTLSASTLSVSSSSSLGSLSTASSKGSLSSGLSFTDIYGAPQISGSLQSDKPVDMVDLHRRVERLLRGGLGESAGSSPSAPSLSPRSSLSSASPPPPLADLPPPPAYTQIERQRRQQRELEEKLAEMRIGGSIGLGEVSGLAQGPLQHQGPGRPSEPLSPISETPPLSPLTPTSSGSNTRSVSAAVSDESVAGDSGVFEAAQAGASPAVNSAQIEIKLRYSGEDNTLHIGILRARNLHALFVELGTKICVKGALVMGGGAGGRAFCSAEATWCGGGVSWCETVSARVPGRRAAAACTLQINLAAGPECVGCAQVSLADFDPDGVSQKWYNLLGFRYMRPEADPGCALVPRDESSDDSTVISSQTSTLTRNRGPEAMAECATECGNNSASEDDEQRETLNQIVEEDCLEECACESARQYHLEPSTAEKETNTECNFCPEGSRLHRRKSQQCNSSAEEPLATIKRSQTFSPQPQGIGKGQYICRLNRSESDSSMAQYARRLASAMPAPLTAGIPFDRSIRERRSLRRGRMSGAACARPRGSSQRVKTPRTSLDLALDLKAQHRRLADLREEIDSLTQLKNKLEDACERGDTNVATWVAQDESLRRLVEAPSVPADSERASRLLHRTSREIYKLRRTRQGGRKPDLITFKEKMAFFTRNKCSIPVLPGEEDEACSEDEWLDQDEDERRTPDGRSSRGQFEVRRSQRQTQLAPPSPRIEAETTDTAKEEEFDFVVDRVLGVEV